MDIKPIKTESDYAHAMQRLDEIFDASPGTPEGDELEVLGTLIDAYENTQCPIELKEDPIEAIKFKMDQLNYTPLDLAKLIHSKNINEILNRERKLTLKNIRMLSKGLNISADVLIQEY
ncbi:MAG: transcriptional regulator [Bacteroidota bacterium]